MINQSMLWDYGILVAKVTIDGLGICCFNTANKRWEVAFMQGEHEASVQVKKLGADGSETTVLAPTTFKKEILDVSMANGSEAHYHSYPDGYFFTESFSRKEAHDFRWVIDFVGGEIPHGQFLSLKKPNSPVTIVRIPNALFFTQQLTPYPVKLVPIGSPSKEGFELGCVNEAIGAEIFAYAGGAITLLEKENEEDRGTSLGGPFEYETGQIYLIELTNMDTDKAARQSKLMRQLNEPALVPGDLHNYYEMIKVSGRGYEIWTAPNEPSFFIRTADCHSVRATVNTLMPLIEPGA